MHTAASPSNGTPLPSDMPQHAPPTPTISAPSAGPLRLRHPQKRLALLVDEPADAGGRSCLQQVWQQAFVETRQAFALHRQPEDVDHAAVLQGLTPNSLRLQPPAAIPDMSLLCLAAKWGDPES
jgi:hypothetical protein